jgi:hypothetical protein
MFFFEKKNQKTFANLAFARTEFTAFQSPRPLTLFGQGSTLPLVPR